MKDTVLAKTPAAAAVEGPAQRKGELPLLSVIVTAYTLERWPDLRDLLLSIEAQAYERMEIIFVGEAERELCQRVEAFAAERKMGNVRTLFNDGPPGLSAARNRGAAAARGEILAFLDDDAVALPGWAEATVRTYLDGEGVIATTGPAAPLWEDDSLTWLPEEFYWFVSCTNWTGWERPRDVRNAWGMNMSFRREVFETCGGFRTAFGLRNSARTTWNDPPSEDVDLSLRARRASGGRIVYNPEAGVKHRVCHKRLKWGFVAQRSYSVGYQRRALQRLYGGDGEDRQLLAQEMDLTRRIVFGLVPRSIVMAFRRPLLAWKQLSLVVVSMAFVALGYLSGMLSPLPGEEDAVSKEELTGKAG